MARTALTVTTAPGNYASAGVAVTMDAADAVNQNKVTLTGKELVIAQNTGASTRTVTITSVADPFGRTGNFTTENIAAGAIRVYGPFPTVGWQQTDGQLYLEANHAEVKFGIIRLP